MRFVSLTQRESDLAMTLRLNASAWVLGFLTLCIPALSGCGGSNPPTTPNPSNTQANAPGAKVEPAAPSVRTVAADTLPIGDYLPPLDGGKVEVAKPKDWTVPSRDKKYVVRFRRSSTSNFPRIHVTTEDDDWSGITDLTADNVAQFAKALQDKLDADESVTLIEPVIPMILGNQPVARYVRRTRFKTAEKSVTVERQILFTRGAGKIYIVDLQTPSGRIPAYRDAGYAVAASLKFQAGSESETTVPEGDGPSPSTDEPKN